MHRSRRRSLRLQDPVLEMADEPDIAAACAVGGGHCVESGWSPAAAMMPRCQAVKYCEYSANHQTARLVVVVLGMGGVISGGDPKWFGRSRG